MTSQGAPSEKVGEKESSCAGTTAHDDLVIMQQADSEEVVQSRLEHVDTVEDLDLDGLDPIYRAKVHCLNRAMQDIGMGRYQWLLFCLTGFGWMADNASTSLPSSQWAMAASSRRVLT